MNTEIYSQGVSRENMMRKKPTKADLELRVQELEQELKTVSEAARKSEESFQSLFEHSHELFFILDFDGRFLNANDRALEKLGYTRDEIPTVSLATIVRSEDLPRALKHLQDMQNQGFSENMEPIEYGLLKKDGGLIWVEANSSVVCHDGKPYAIQGFARDITERKQARERLRMSEERYRTIFENTGSASALIAGDATIVFANSNFEKITGYTKEEMEGKMSCDKFIVPEDLARMNDYRSKRLKSPEAAPGNYEFRMKNRSGEVRDIFITVALVPGTKEIIASCMDITDMKRAEQELRLSEEKYRGILESMEEGYFEIDLKGNFTFNNEASRKGLGYSEEEMRGLNYRSFMSPQTVRHMRDVFGRIYRTGRPEFLMDYEVICKDGTIRIHEMNTGLMRDHAGQPTGFRGVVRDVTERKKAEDDLRKSEDRYRAIFENTGSASILIAQDTTILLANSKFASLTGYGKEEMEGKMSWTVFVDEADLERMKRYHVQRRVDPTSAPQIYEFRLKTRSGDFRDILLTIVMIPGTMESVASCMDITDRKRAEEALKERETKYRFLTEKMNDVVWTMDLEMRTTFVSPSISRVLGFTPEERMAQMPQDQMTPESYEDAIRQLAYELERDRQQGVDPDRTITFEAEYYHKDGSRVWLENKISGIRDENGTLIGLHGVSRDINERMKAAVALRESEERWLFALEGAGDGVWDYDMAARKVYRSRRWKEMLGYAEDEIGDEPQEWTRLVHEDDLKLSEENLNSHLRGESPIYTSENRIRCKDGSYKWILERGKVIRWSEDGKPMRIIGTQTDITDRKKAEEAIRLSEEKYRSILESMDEGYLETDLSGNFSFFNDSFCRILGYSREELMGMSYKETSRPEAHASIFHAFNEIFRTSRKKTFLDYEVIRKDGTTRIVEMSASMLLGPSGEHLGFCGVGRDITERIKAEQALKESERRYRMIAENVHDSILTLDLNLKFTYMSPSISRITGFTIEELQSKAIQELLTPESYEYAEKVLEQELFREHGEEPVEPDRSRVMELEVVCKDGSTVWIELMATFNRDESGRAKEILGVARDISERVKARDELREINRRLNALVQAMPDVVYFKDASGRNLEVNRAYELMTGMKKQDILGKTDAEVLPSDLAQQCILSDAEAMRYGRPMRFEELLRLPNGTEVFFDTIKSPIFDDAGKFIGLVGVSRDITERKQAEVALLESEKRYRSLFDGMMDGVYRCTHEGRFVNINNAMARIFGYSSIEEMMNVDVKKELYFSEEDRESHLLDIGQGESDVFRMRRKDGSEIWVEDHGHHVCNEKGEIIFHEGIIRDVTEHKMSEEAIKKSEEFYRTIFENTGNASMLLGEDTTVLLVNSNFEKLSGYTREEIEGKMSWTRFVSPEDLQKMKMYHEMRRVKPESAPDAYEFQFINRWGERRSIFLSIALIPGTKISVASLLDITEKQNLEQQLTRAQKMEAIGTLAGGIAHDFNNLLMGILGNVSLMLVHLDDTHPFFDRLKSMEEYVQRGSDLTKQLLGFARGGKYEVKPTDMGKFVRKSSEMFGRTRKEIRIHSKAQEGLWSVDVDRGQMEQVMLNLFVNAWQAMPGGGDLFVSAENAQLGESDVSPYGLQPGRYVKVTVTDTGIGMEESVRARIFEPFFTTKERGRGTGLGLASVYGIVKNHGGFILVESEKDLGTSFMIFLPASGKDIVEELKAEGEIKKGQETVLLIDDEEMILDVGSSILEGLGYKVVTASGGRQGLKIFEQAKDTIDLVILDMIMPDFGGRETFDTLRRIKPDVKVLLSSGYSLDGQAKEIMKSGCKGFIQKPFSMADLSKKLREILDSD